ncbi:hypothetical protein [Empedobacter sedimenti]|uniref:hypothetical protein n=1 Tax=Empedobacter sedimenti TaxID=3042610 RepID=UPI0024A75832|nr:hypothetical protein [Empedobacter sedimenti]
MNNSIGGEQNPTIGKEYNYFITDMLDVNLTITNEVSTYIWHIYVKLKNGKIVDITKDGGKIGSEVPYSFSEKAINKEYILVVNRATKKLLSTDYKFEKIAEFHIFPTTSTETKIEKVILFNKGAKDVNKASYTDTLVARAYCIGMVDKEIEFQLWEDDAKGKGHDATVNKNNTDSKFIFKATVNRKGIAEAKIPLSSDPKLLQKIANRYLMAGDKTEGANHEYYVTASYLGDIKGASQVNVDVKNPDNNKTQKPKPDSAKGSSNSNSKNNQPDKKGDVSSVKLLNAKKTPITKATFEDTIYVQIKGNNLDKKKYTLKIWEDDDFGENDLLYKGEHIFSTNTYQEVKVTLTDEFRKIGELGNDPKNPDKGEYWTGNYQEVFAEVELLTQVTKSAIIEVSLNAKITPPEQTIAVSTIGKQDKKKEENTTCVCKQYDLIWGNKVSCEFRKKVVEICAELWGESRKIEMANGLMAVIYVETSSTFSASKIELKPTGEYRKDGKAKKDYRGLTKDEILQLDENFTGAVGLIQFTPVAIKDLNKEFSLKLTKRKLALMNEIEQLDYVKKYFQLYKWFTKLKKPEDIVIFPLLGTFKSIVFI